jgi:hypothetical protein
MFRRLSLLNLAVGGYDTVAYFTVGKPVKANQNWPAVLGK